MFQLIPTIDSKSTCQNCKATSTGKIEIEYLGMLWTRSYRCGECGAKNYEPLPYGHYNQFNCSFFVIDGKITFNEDCPEWIETGIHSIVNSKTPEDVVIEKIGKANGKSVVLINCLDSCYGHVLWKMLNLEKHKKNNQVEVILIIPRNVAWLLPLDIEEAWVVDVGLSYLNSTISGFNEFVTSELKRFENILLSPTDSFPVDLKGHLAEYTKTPPFDKSKFNDLPYNITLILRENRFWLRFKIEEWLYLAGRKFKLGYWFNIGFVYRQNKLVNALVNSLNSEHQHFKITVVGFGKSGKLNRRINDQRVDALSPEIERKWCDIYARSHVVIGVHGSGMLLPTSLAAGYINILPSYKVSNKGEDIAAPGDEKSLEILGRHVKQFTSPKEIMFQIEKLITDYSNHIKEG